MKFRKAIAAAMAALMLATAPAVTEAHFLSSAQERSRGLDAANDFKAKHRTYDDPVLTTIQQRLIKFNSNKLWMYGSNKSKRGLDPIKAVDSNSANAFCFPGGFIFVTRGEMEMNASINDFAYHESTQLPWRRANIYQYSSLAATVGHECAHWEHEDFLRKFDKMFGTGILMSLIPVANIYTALGVIAGSNIINAFNSRQMGFRTEQQADEGALEYLENVPEYSIGGVATTMFRMGEREKRSRGGGGGFSDWLNPHSKAEIRVKRALDYMRVTSNGFIEWRGLNFYYDGKQGELLAANRDGGQLTRTFYVLGQIASSIKFGICSTDKIQIFRGDELFNDGLPDETFVALCGNDKNGLIRVKVVDKLFIPKDVFMRALARHGTDTKKLAQIRVKNTCDEVIINLTNYANVYKIIKAYEDNRFHYMFKNNLELDPLSEDDEMDI